MGMFDYIRCEAPLPDGYTGICQTKDFNCEMVTHVITKDGRLMLSRVDRVEEVPMEERPHPNGEGILKWAGSQRWITSLHDANFHGYVYFGALETIGYEPHENWRPPGRPIHRDHDYRAKFTDGQLVGIEIDLQPPHQRSER